VEQRVEARGGLGWCQSPAPACYKWKLIKEARGGGEEEDC
jgi:hypothetical protein